MGEKTGDADQVTLYRSKDGKTWCYGDIFRTEFPPPPIFGSTNVILGFSPATNPSPDFMSGGIWLMGGNSFSGGVLQPSIYWSVVDFCDSASPKGATGEAANGRSFPVSFALGDTFWLAAVNPNIGVGDKVVFWSSTNGTHWVNHTMDVGFPVVSTSSGIQVLYVNRAWYFVVSFGILRSFDGKTSFQVIAAFPGVFKGDNILDLDISPFGEYWMAVGAKNASAGNTVDFVYSFGGVNWVDVFSPVTVGAPVAVLKDVCYGAGQFVMVGGVENTGTLSSFYNHSILVAKNPLDVKGMGTKWFADVNGNPHTGRKTVYSETQSLFGLCGAFGFSGSSIITSFNPYNNDFQPTNGAMDILCKDICTRTRPNGVYTSSSATLADVNGTQINDASATLFVQKARVSFGDLKSKGRLVFGNSSELIVEGSLYLSGLMQLASNVSISTDVAVVMLPGSVLEVQLSSPPIVGASVVQIPLFSFNFSVGSFSATRAVVQYDSCSIAATPIVSYGSSSASVLVSVDASACNMGPVGLSTEAIVGIAVGVTVAGIVVAVGIGLLTKYLISRHTARANFAISKNEMLLMQNRILK